MQPWLHSAWNKILAPLRNSALDDPPDPSAPRQLELYDLEERILFNAAPIGAEVLVAAAEMTQAEAAPQLPDAEAPQSDSIAAQDAPTLNNEVEVQRELVFVDGSAQNVDEQLHSILERDDSPRELTVVMLEEGRDHLAQISESLREHTGLSAVHFVSDSADQSGSAAALFQESLAGHAAEIADWADSLSADAKLFVHDSGLTESDGQELADALGALTHSDVIVDGAASATAETSADSHDGAQVVLIDSNLEDLATLTNAVADGARIFYYDSHTESVDYVLGEVTDWARDAHVQVDSLVILSHGSAGAFGLGDQMIAMSNVDLSEAAWRDLAAVMTTDATIGVYGCNVADASGDGQLLIDRLAELTGAEVFASSNLTGYSGDWNLEVGSFGTGSEIYVDRGIALDLQGLQSYGFNLASTAQGSETRANTTTSGTQETNTGVPGRAVAMDSAGNYVVVWDGSGSGDTDGIFAQRFNASGVAQGSEFRVNTTTTGVQGLASVAMDDSGNFVITWATDIGGSNAAVKAQMYNASGVAQGSEISVNTSTNGTQTNPVIAMYSSGFVIAWDDDTTEGTGTNGVYAQRFNSSGTKQGSEFRVNTTTANDQWIDSVACDANGNFIVTWASNLQDGDGYGIYFKRYNASGTALSGEVRANTTTAHDQGRSSVAMNDSGAFVITWTDSDADGGANDGVMAQRYNSSGVAQGSEFQVNTTTAGSQYKSMAGIDQSGNFVITWSSYNQDSSNTYGVYRRDYYADGTSASSETRVNTTISGNQTYGSIAMNEVGQYVIAWSGNGTGDTSGVFFQRYTETNQTPINTVAGAQWANGAAPLEFSTANGNAISISDADGGTSDHQVTLTVTNGTLTLATTSGLSFSSGDGTGDATMTFTGSMTSINAALDGLSYTVTPFYSGTDSLQIVTSDLANVGTGSALTDTDSVTINVAAPSTPYMITGSYTGNGTDNRNITGLGFQPDVVLIKARTAQIGVMRTSSMVGDVSKDMTGATAVGANLIQSLLSDGFQVGTDASVNTNGVVYDYVVFKAAAGFLSVGSYSGTGVAGRTVTGLGMSPDALFVMDSAGQEAVFSTTAEEGYSYNFGTGSAKTNYISSLDNDGFTVGSDNRVNQSGHTYYYIAWNEMAGSMDVGSYTGTGVDNRNITGVGFQSEWMMVSGGAVDTVQHFDSQGATTDSSSFFSGTTSTTNRIQQLQSDGFQVGTDADVNSNGVSYQYLAFKQQTAVTLSSISNQTINEDGNTGAIAFTIGDAETSVANLSVRVTSSNSTLVPSGNLVLGGSGANRTLTITPAANMNGTATITVDVTDGATITTQTFTLTVNAVNDVPVRTAGSPAAISVNEDSANTTAVSLGMGSLTYGVGGGSDEAAQTLTYKITAIPTHMTLWLADGTTQVSANTTLSLAQLQGLKYKTVANANGAGNLTWTVQDSGGTANGGVDTLTETLSVTVNSVNDVPVRTAGSPAAINVNEDSANSTAVSLGMGSLTYGVGGGSDESAQTLTYKVTVIPSHMTLWLADGTTQVSANTTLSLAQLQGLKYKTVADANGSGNLTWTVQDSGGTSNGGVDTLTETLTVTVNAVNDAPVRTAGSPAAVNVNEDSANTTAVSLGMGSLTYGNGGASDESGQSLTYTVTAIPSFVTLWLADGTTQVTSNTAVSLAQLQGLKYKTVADANGSGNLTWTVQDSGGTANGGANLLTENLSITVNAVNDAPIISSNGGGTTANVSVNENSTAVATVTSTDIDGGTAVYSISGGTDSTRFAINSSTGALTFAVAPNAESPIDSNTDNIYVVIVQVSDGAGGLDTQTITVTVNDLDEFDVGAVSDSNVASNSVAENATNGTIVGLTASASDADATTNAITYSLSDNAGGRFAINATTGVVTVANGTLLNREAAASHNITVVATSADGSTSNATFTINLTDVDEFDVGAVSDTNAAANSVAENAANGTVVGITASASDADATTNAISYSLSDSAGGRFAINATTSVVTVADGTLLNREAAASHNITVVATSADGSTSNATFTINLTDVDEFDVGAVSDANAAANSVAENAANGTVVGITASASDADATTNGITYSLSDSAGGRFAINASTGVITVADGTLLNREAAASHNVTVVATSADGSTSNATFTINLTDVDEFDVGTVSDTNAAANSVAENAANGTVVGITASASDADATTNAITYSLSDSAGGRFAINATTGVVTVADGTLLNREAAASHSITVVATSADGSTSNATFTINLTDVDEFDVGAVSDTNAAANSVAENAANGTVVGVTASASDADATTNAITYSLSDSAGGRFAINASTGVVTVADGTLLNREAAASHNITIVATSADGSTSNATFTINLTDVDEFDVGAVSDTNAAANSVAENATNGTVVGITASASDADATTNAITYSLSDSAGGRFAINSTTGVVTVADGTLLNREAAASHNITVVATSADGSTSNATFTINLTDVDEFDVGAVSDANAAANNVAENATNGTVVGITASASDADATTNGITYSLSDSAGGRFAINASTGVITVADGTLLNREAAASHNVTVVATSADGSISNATFTINLTDVDEFDVGAVSDANAAANSVAENAANGTTVGITAAASDADATTNGITYSLSDDAGGRFAINASTGVITVADGTLLNRETAASYNVTVLATSADGSTSNASFTINLTDVDEFDAGAVSDTNAAANSVAENAANGTVVGITASASDADATTNAISYSLSDSAGGRFAINATTGVVTVADGTLLNREAAASHNITILATSADGSTSSATFTINLTDVDEFDVGTVSDADAAANSVAENATNGATVGITAAASDGDATTNAVTYSLSDDAGGRFAINASTGVVTVANGTLLNREAAASYNITVLASSADGSTSNATFTINLTDVDEFDVSAVSDTNAAANSVAENAANGTTVGITAAASDADATTSGITYSLTDDAGGRFAINASTGVVTVADGSLLNREAAASYNVTVLATSADGSTSNATFTINLTDVDEFDVGAVSDANAAANSVAENAVNGTTVGLTATASDADATTNAISYSLTDDAGGRFAINASTGVVTVADGTLLNRESAASYNITVLATSADGSSSNATFTINLTDVDEFDIGTVTDVNAAANSVAENAANGTTVGLTAAATDADATTSAITYSLSDDAGGRFAINATTGVVTVADGTLLNRESAAAYNITVVASSADGSTSNATFTINLTDVDEFDVGAVSDTNAVANSIAENAANGTTVGITASATDADATTNAIAYSLIDDAGGRFAINASTGVVTVADGSLLDRETAASHNVTVRATSADGSTSDATFTINLTDVDEVDVGAVTDANAAANSVAENAANGTTVGVTAAAADADATTSAITYSLVDDAGGRFAIDSTTGVVTVADGSLLNREAAASHNVTVRATSADGSTSDATFTINLTDVDEFDVGAVTDANAAANSVAENATAGTVVGLTATASDADATTNTISYSLTDDAGGRFAINASTGVVTVADGTLLNREAAASHNITVRATSADGSTSDATFTINLTDVDEFDVGAVTDVNAAANNVTENAANGTVVGITAAASDADATTNAIAYSLTDDAGGRFAINTATGVVTVADGTLLNREAAASHNITVRATSADGSTSDSTFTINLTDIDEFDVGAIADANVATDSVAENAANGTVVGITANAVDADATTNAITYSLTDNAGGRFAIDATTGVVTVADGSLLDRQAAASHDITVQATSADGSISSATFTILLTDVDDFDVGPVSDTNAAANSVAENAANGTIVGITANAVDADATTNIVTYSLTDDAGGRFAIDATTGVVTVADGSLLDRESAASYNVTVLATSEDGSTSNATFTINLTDIDEFDVGAVSDANAAVNSVTENAANGTVVGLTATASDADATTNAISYALTDDAGGRFAINAATGVVTVGDGSLLDREAAAAHNITVRATSADGSTSDTTFTINLTDVDESDVGAVTDANAAANSVAENAANGTVIGITAAAADADATTSAVTYSLTDDAGGRFAVNALTGVVTVADGSLLNREAAASHNITVRATSADGSTSDATFTINLTDVDEFDVGAVSDADAAADSVAENAANGTVVGITAAAADADATTNAITYSLVDDAGGRFAINASTGVVTVADGSLLDRETAASHNVTVRATSADGSTSDATFTINLTDVDEFDIGAVSDANAAANSVAENAANGTVVGLTAVAADTDATTNAVSYSLVDDAGGRFAINASTGVVTVADGSLLNREAAASHNVTVRATSADGSTSDATFTINLTDVDEFDVGAVSDVNAAANSVAENAVNGTVVGITAAAADADATTNTITYSLTDDAGGRFAINATTGVVTVADGSLLDRESAASHNVTVRATSADGSTSDTIFTINLTDVDEFAVSAITDADAATNSVAENAANGTTVGLTASASDSDAATNSVTYSLTDDAGGRFAINAATGVVTVANGTLLDRESAASYNVTVRATSADGSTSDATFTINLTDVDEFDVGAVSDTNAAADSIAENAANGTVVGITASATDADATTSAITYSLIDDAGGRFAINASTGVVTVADGSLLDRETAASHNVTVRATSADGSTSDATFTINLTDVDESDVSAVTDVDATANNVAENAANGTVAGITAAATDADATTNGITYTLVDDAGGRFAIDATTGVVTVADGTLLNREAAASHNVTVRATSADGSTSDATFTINLTDVDEFDAGTVTDANAAANSVAENAANGTVVGLTVTASDADATTNAISYSLTDDAGGRFAIDASTGVVTVADGSLLDRESAASHNVTVRATSSDGSTSDTTFTINLTDADEFDVGAVTDTNAAANSVAENAANGTVVGITAAASDADATTNAITYSLVDDAGGRFAINASTGVVTVADGSLLDREAAAFHNVTVRATSADGSTSDATFTINLTDVDESDIGAVSDTNATANSVAENAANGTVVGLTAVAADADATTNAVTYSLVDDAGGRFAINASTGVVTVADSSLLNRESAASHNVTIRATSADGSTSDATFTINLTDVDEFDVGAVTDANAAANSVAENAANGTAVGITATASDADATTNAITYSLLDNAGGRFAINATTGVVTVANGSLLDREAAASHNVTVRTTSADGSISDTTFTINLIDMDDFDVGAVSDGNAAANFIAENAANGTAVGITAQAADADATNNSVTYSLTDDAGGRFAIDATTGIVTVADSSLLDRESAASYNVTVRATSADGSISQATFAISLTDVDEFDVGPVSDTNGAANSVAENAANGTAVGIAAQAADADATTNGITYSLTDDAGGRFAINATTGVVTVADGSLLDREAAASHNVTVRATSADGSTSDATLTINLADADEFNVGTVADVNAGTNSVAENAADGTAVGITAFATDSDTTNNGITYSLVDNAGGRFAIDAVTGVVTVADGSLLNREAAAAHNITIRATSADGSTSDATFTISLSDVNESAVGAVGDVNGAANSVAENAANGTSVGITASASDADATTNAVTYSLTDDAGGRFAIDAVTGLVTVADGTLLDREAASSFNVTVRATSADGSTSDATFTISLTDVSEFDVGPVSDVAAAPNNVAENAVNGTAVGITATAGDADATTNAITYSLLDNAGGRFAINATTGVVTVADGSLLNRESAALHNITVRATSADGSTSDATFTINLTDVDEFNVGAAADLDSAANRVAENAATGTAVGITASAEDADVTANSVTYGLSDDAGGRFAIDALTGVVTVADGTLLDRESAASYSVTVLAVSSDGSTSTTTFTISLIDVNEFGVGAVSDTNTAVDSVAENAANGTPVGITAFASDADATANGVTYSLTDDTGGRFAIHAVTGVVTVADGAALPGAASYDLVVRATSADGSFSEQLFAVAIAPSDAPPIVNFVPGLAFTIPDTVASTSYSGNAANSISASVTTTATAATNATVTTTGPAQSDLNPGSKDLGTFATPINLHWAHHSESPAAKSAAPTTVRSELRTTPALESRWDGPNFEYYAGTNARSSATDGVTPQQLVLQSLEAEENLTPETDDSELSWSTCVVGAVSGYLGYQLLGMELVRKRLLTRVLGE